MREYLKNKIRRISENQCEYLTLKEIGRIKEHVKSKWETKEDNSKADERNIKKPEFYVAKFFN